MDGGDYASIVAAIVAAFSAWAVARSSSRANKQAKELETKALVDTKELENDANRETLRQQAETAAYERARAFDTETITRQATQITELKMAIGERESELGQVRTDNQMLHNDVRMTSQENRDLHAELSEAHRVIENLRSYIRHNPLIPKEVDVPEELDRPLEMPPTTNPELRRVIDNYVEPGDSYPDQD